MRPNDLSSWWMPFTSNRTFKAAPRMIEGAAGMYFRSQDGRQILDAVAGLWCVNAGHARETIADAVREQLMILDYAPGFQYGHSLAFALANRLAAMLPANLNHLFFCNSGSEAVDSALKIALVYHRLNGEGTRTRLIGRERGYHGTGFGGISVGGIGGNRAPYGCMLPGVDHLPHTHDLSRAFTRGQPHNGADLAEALLPIIALHGAANIAAVIVEPLAGSTGVLPPPMGYLERLREICTAHGILLIFDEVITGFGRLGVGFAADHLGIAPDIMTLAKGITNGVVPMGAVAISTTIHTQIMQSAATAIELPHGYTSSGHPVACAAAMATLDIYENEALFARAGRMAPVLEEHAHALRDAPHVIDVRNWGLVAAIELRPGQEAGARGTAMMQACWEAGMMIRVTGDVIALSPPLIVNEEQIAQIFGMIRGCLEAIR